MLADGAVVGRILKVHAAPVGTPWMWGADGIIVKRIVELAKAGECNPDLLCQGAIEQLRGHLYGD